MLIFSHLCRAVAVIGLLYSAFVFWAAYNAHMIIDQAAATQWADFNMRHGAETLLAAIVLGTLAEISFSLRKRANG